MYYSQMDIAIVNCREALKKDQEHGRELDGYLRIDKPSWVEEDDLQRFFAAYEDLLQNGVVVWGALIQANVDLFSSGKCDLPGEVVYCKNPFTRCDVGQLEWLASEIGDLKEEMSEDPAVQKIADYLKDERIRVFGWPIPTTMDPKGMFQISTVFFARHHLPNKKLSGAVFPVIIDKDNPSVAMVLPYKYWPKDLIDAWNQQRNNRYISKKPRTPKILHLSFYNTVFATLATLGLLFFFVIPNAYMKFFPLQKMTCGDFFKAQTKPFAVEFSDGALDYSKVVTVKDKIYVPVRARQKKHKFIRVVIELPKDVDRKKTQAMGTQEFYTDVKLQQQITNEMSIRHGVRVKDLLILTTAETNKQLLWILLAVFVIACGLSILNVLRYIGMFRHGSYDEDSHKQLFIAGGLILFMAIIGFYISLNSWYVRHKNSKPVEKSTSDFYKSPDNTVNISLRDCTIDYTKAVHFKHQIVAPVFPKGVSSGEMRLFLILDDWNKKNRARKYLHLKSKGKRPRLLTNYKTILGLVTTEESHKHIITKMSNKGKVAKNYIFIEENKELPSIFFIVSRGIWAMLCLILGLWIVAKTQDE